MAKNDLTPEEVAKEDETQAEDNVESKTSKIDVGGMADSMGKNVKVFTETFADAEKRKHFFTSEDMEPHRMLLILLGLTVLITVVVALIF